MELPAYHLPTVGSVLRSMWERGWSFIKKAGTIILLLYHRNLVYHLLWICRRQASRCWQRIRSITVSLPRSVNAISWIFIPQGWGNWQATVASITGLVAKENIVGTLGILYGGGDGSVYADMASEVYGNYRIQLPGIQPSVCTVLRSNGCNQDVR